MFTILMKPWLVKLMVREKLTQSECVVDVKGRGIITAVFG